MTMLPSNLKIAFLLLLLLLQSIKQLVYLHRLTQRLPITIRLHCSTVASEEVVAALDCTVDVNILKKIVLQYAAFVLLSVAVVLTI
jgi:hypothetical protein